MENSPDRKRVIPFGLNLLSAGRILLLGSALGFVLAWAPGTFLVLTLVLLTCGAIRRLGPEEDRRFLQWVFLLSLGIRILLAVLNQYFLVETLKVPLLGPDGERYSTGGWYISRIISGARFEPLFSAEFHRLFPNSIKFFDYVDFTHRFRGRYLPDLTYHGVGIFTYGIAFLYSLIGYAPLALKWLNGFLGSLLPLVAYGLGRAIFGRPSAGRLSAVLSALHPSLLVWSVTALKDPLVNLSALFFLYSLARCLTGRWIWGWGVVAGAAGMALFRPWTGTLVWITLGVGGLGWLLARLRWTARTVAAGAAVLLVGLMVYYQPAARDFPSRAVSRWKEGYASSYNDPQRSRYRIFPASAYREDFEDAARRRRIVEKRHPVYREEFKDAARKRGVPQKMVARPLTAGELFQGLVVGVAHFLFLPYPCCAEGAHQAAASVVFLLWSALLPFALLGYLQSWRENPRVAWFLGVFAVAASLAIALNSYIVWSLVRHRDLVSPLFLVWAAGGLCRIGGRRLEESPAGGLRPTGLVESSRPLSTG